MTDPPPPLLSSSLPPLQEPPLILLSSRLMIIYTRHYHLLPYLQGQVDPPLILCIHTLPPCSPQLPTQLPSSCFISHPPCNPIVVFWNPRSCLTHSHLDVACLLSRAFVTQRFSDYRAEASSIWSLVTEWTSVAVLAPFTHSHARRVMPVSNDNSLCVSSCLRRPDTTCNQRIGTA